MRLFTCVALLLLVACAGAAPAEPPAYPRSASAVATARGPSTEAAAPTPPARTAPADAEGAARAFFEAIATHDVSGAVWVSEEAFGRGQVSRYAAVTDVSFDGPAEPDAWPHLSDTSFFWGTFTTKEKSERILIAVRHHPERGWRVAGLRDEAMRADVERELALRKRPQASSEAKGKLLTKPAKSILTVSVDSGSVSVGDEVELLRRVDPSVPFVGGSWLVIANTEVTAVAGKTATLKIVAEKAAMRVNGRKLDHFTPNVPVILKKKPPAP